VKVLRVSSRCLRALGVRIQIQTSILDSILQRSMPWPIGSFGKQKMASNSGYRQVASSTTKALNPFETEMERALRLPVLGIAHSLATDNHSQLTTDSSLSHCYPPSCISVRCRSCIAHAVLFFAHSLLAPRRCCRRYPQAQAPP